ncbi:50S ribosomal protein L6 [Desulfatitalea tepidiphila]|uniref:50S ribosomal protein L6 n=1 Tax=Desulfatitalea tepidiphila TaxID=1185843 RepID=UPI0006B5772D|nr:50S ribosomal protein L6 [Desulfatitalea tepidiphila]
MSRVGKKPVALPEKTTINFKDGMVTVQGKNGKLTHMVHPDIDLKIEADRIEVVSKTEDRKASALQGMTRSLLDNMVTGVSKGYERVLEINGIGYRAEAKGKSILFNLGYSHPIDFPLPDGVSATVEKNNIVKLAGIDKHLLGQTAARIRQLRPPEPYKGKGIKYAEEYIQRKAGKTGTK